jgi:hypothetical protein
MVSQLLTKTRSSTKPINEKRKLEREASEKRRLEIMSNQSKQKEINKKERNTKNCQEYLNDLISKLDNIDKYKLWVLFILTIIHDNEIDKKTFYSLLNSILDNYKSEIKLIRFKCNNIYNFIMELNNKKINEIFRIRPIQGIASAGKTIIWYNKKYEAIVYSNVVLSGNKRENRILGEIRVFIASEIETGTKLEFRNPPKGHDIIIYDEKLDKYPDIKGIFNKSSSNNRSKGVHNPNQY